MLPKYLPEVSYSYFWLVHKNQTVFPEVLIVI